MCCFDVIYVLEKGLNNRNEYKCKLFFLDGIMYLKIILIFCRFRLRIDRYIFCKYIYMYVKNNIWNCIVLIFDYKWLIGIYWYNFIECKKGWNICYIEFFFGDS